MTGRDRVLMFPPLDQLWACCNVMGLFSHVSLRGGNMERGLDLVVSRCSCRIGPARVK